MFEIQGLSRSQIRMRSVSNLNLHNSWYYRRPSSWKSTYPRSFSLTNLLTTQNLITAKKTLFEFWFYWKCKWILQILGRRITPIHVYATLLFNPFFEIFMNIVTIFHFQYRQPVAFEENRSYRKDTIIEENYYFNTLDISFGNLICRKTWSVIH